MSVVLAALVILVDYHFNFSNSMTSNGHRLLISTNIRYVGYTCLVACLISSVGFLNSPKSLLFILTLIVNFSFLIWLGGRGACLAYLLSLLVYFYLMRGRVGSKRFFNLMLLLFLSALISVPFNVYPWNGMNRFLNVVNYSEQSLNQISSSRIALWQESLSLIIQNPIFGSGPEAHLFNSKIGFMQPHNFVLQFLLEFGVIGGSFLCFSMIFIIYAAWINLKLENKLTNSYSFCIVLGIMIHSLYDGSLYHASSVFIFCFVSAYILAVYFSNKKEKILLNEIKQNS